MKKTIKQQVADAADTLKAMTTHTDLRNWAISNGMDNRAAFPKFKNALREIGLDYDDIKRGININDGINAGVEDETSIPQLSNIEKIAKEIGGKYWQKGDKRRIYVNGGNNYHYDGKWYVDFDADGAWTVECWMNEGYDNKNAKEYVAKHKAAIRDEVRQAEITLGLKAEQATDSNEPGAAEYIGDLANFGDNNYNYPSNFYNGCGSYYLAFNDAGKIVASVNYTPECDRSDYQQRDYLIKQLTDKGIPFIGVIPADGNGTTFFARDEVAAESLGLKMKIYTVPSAYGGRHKNIELILK